MTVNAVFVDLPNLYGSLIRSDLDRPDTLRNYFLTWFDLDLLARHLTGGNPNIWVFYSGQRIGSSEARVDGNFLKSYINRINSLQGVTARDVNIPGDQREPIAVKCEKCGHDATTEWKSEKGIDSSLTVHLFDTMNYWDVAYLLSGDADFIPVVASLRRRGKIVIGAGFPKASSALIQECYNYENLVDKFFKRDIVMYEIFYVDGILAKLLHSVEPQNASVLKKLKIISFFTPRSELVIRVEGSCKVEDFESSLNSCLSRYQIDFHKDKSSESMIFSFTIDSIHIIGAKRRFYDLCRLVRGLYQIQDGSGCVIEYNYNTTEGKYEPIIK